jgi:hypothetical protein
VLTRVGIERRAGSTTFRTSSPAACASGDRHRAAASAALTRRRADDGARRLDQAQILAEILAHGARLGMAMIGSADLATLSSTPTPSR